MLEYRAQNNNHHITVQINPSSLDMAKQATQSNTNSIRCGHVACWISAFSSRYYPSLPHTLAILSTACANNGAFCCTGERVINSQGVELPHPTYINPDDCQKFYVCLNGQTPQESSCSLGQVYNEKTMMCDFPEHVPEW